MKKYIVIKDYQGGEFGMYRAYTAEEWGEQAYEWADSDDWENPDKCLLENFETEKELIDFISDMWEIKIVELNKNNKEVIDYLENVYDMFQDAEEGYWASKILEELENEKEN